MNVNIDTLTTVVEKMLEMEITGINYEATQLQGGTIGNVQLITGIAKTNEGNWPYRVVFKTSKKWERYGDPDSWRREYDLYNSELETTFESDLRWPKCYHAEINEDEISLWLEYIEGVTGLDLTPEMYEQAAYQLGKYQGKLHVKKPEFLQMLTNLSQVDHAKNFYYHYKSWPVVYDYVHSSDCEIPAEICQMLFDFDNDAEAIFTRIEKLPIVFCHRDFWVTNIFSSDGKIVLIDWDTTGWGYLGEDLASLLADEADVENFAQNFHRATAAYYKGFSEYIDVAHINDPCIYEMILALFGYRLVEWYLHAKTPEEKDLHLRTLEEIYRLKEVVHVE